MCTRACVLEHEVRLILFNALLPRCLGVISVFRSTSRALFLFPRVIGFHSISNPNKHTIIDIALNIYSSRDSFNLLIDAVFNFLLNNVLFFLSEVTVLLIYKTCNTFLYIKI